MFIRESSQVAQSFEYLAPYFATTAWLHPLAIDAVGDALQSVHNPSTEDPRPPTITVLSEALRYELGSAWVRPHELAVPMRWNSRLPPELFPELFDGDLRVAGADAARSDLTLLGTYPRSQISSVKPDVVQQATETWARGFLANVLRSFPDNSPS